MAQTTIMLSVSIALLVLVAGASVDNCLDAKECCLYPFGSPEFNNCCTLHGCCPRDCYSFYNVSCCYNQKFYPMGADVNLLPYQCCLKLVCGAILTKEPPFLIPTIIPVSVPSHKDCKTPPLEHCVKDNGIAVTDGSEWQETPCKRCRCVNSVISCWKVKPVCPPAPEPHCIELPGECCPTYDCTKPRVCVDSLGIEHPVGDEWLDPLDLCVRVYCTEFGTVKQPLGCIPPPPPPHQHCSLVTKPGQCCPTWECSVCVDDYGVKHDLGETWHHPGGPCMVYECTVEGPVQKPSRICPVLPPRPNTYCTAIVQDCCPTWNCTGSRGCVDDFGVHHAVGDSWTDPKDPCIRHLCTSNGIQTEFPICIPQQPRPNVDCLEETVECCGRWRCSYCVDNTGRRRAVGEDWTDSHNLCLLHACTEAGHIIDAIIDCPPPSLPPRPDCVWVHEGQCCGFWNCEGCTDINGVHHPLGDVWTDPVDPTSHYLCTEDGITSFSLNCPLPPPRPTPDCTLTTPDDCCPSWSCPTSGCPNPESVIHHCMDVQRNCSTQNYCTPDRQCCPVFGCGNRCLPEMKPGSCPPSSIPLPLCDFPVNKCQEDQDCPYDQKCCWDCGSRCRQPVHQPY
ncbi:hypothetical protein Pcinc_008771 [Petrolisthes cinctipes]|uniref:Kielin/chordin-like protein n=1 Tax=Petrolisthes cinctipes TaxID=88211 RepID=A0AAE1G6K3_PETCI|nr:hypothetical protein Pcinc_008771 [Petrolisthes cinctipes]